MACHTLDRSPSTRNYLVCYSRINFTNTNGYITMHDLLSLAAEVSIHCIFDTKSSVEKKKVISNSLMSLE